MKLNTEGATPEITAGIRAYLAVLQAALDAWNAAHKYPRETLSAQPGRRYLRVVTEREGDQGPSAYSFIDRTNGDVRYASTFRSPDLKGARRGTVLDGSWLEWHGPHGAGYVAEHRPGEVTRKFVSLSADDYMVVRDAIMSGNVAGAVELIAARSPAGATCASSRSTP